MNLIELIELSGKNVFSQGLKSTLTILGVIIGIAAIITLISLGQGLNQVVEKQFELMGMNTIMIEPGDASNKLTSSFVKLKSTDEKIIKNIPGVKKTISFYGGNTVIKVKNQEKQAIIIGVEPSKAEYLTEIGYVDLKEGRNLRQGDKFSVIIYKDLAENGFDKELRLRESIEMNGKKFRIIGISKPSSFTGITGTTFIIIPSQTAKELFDLREPSEISVLAESKELIPRISKEIEKRLEKNHGDKDFYLLTTEQMLDSAKIILGILQLFLIGLAAISLLVGGIGIMNTMLMSVLERTKEIGLMKALGATNQQVLTQFITEAAIIGLIGGTIGTIIGIIFAIIISTIAKTNGFELSINVSIWLISGAMLFALLVGITSGFLPARRAANLDPVDALRYE